MLDYLQLIIATLASSLATTALLGLILPPILKRLIDSVFDVKLERIKLENSQSMARLSAELESTKHARAILIDIRAECYPRISQTVYRSRNDIRDCISKLCQRETAAPDITHLQDIAEWQRMADKCFNEASEACYQHRSILPDDVFRKLHEYKRMLKTFKDTIDTYSKENGTMDIKLPLTNFLTCLEILFAQIMTALKLEAESSSARP